METALSLHVRKSSTADFIFNQTISTHTFTTYFSMMHFNIVVPNTDTLIDVSKEIGLEINVDKTKYMLLSRHQKVGQNRDIKRENRSFENVSQFKYLGTTVTNQNLIQEEIRRRLNSGNVWTEEG
jgi:hypothetical protein